MVKVTTCTPGIVVAELGRVEVAAGAELGVSVMTTTLLLAGCCELAGTVITLV
jgi:hypothetical protein